MRIKVFIFILSVLFVSNSAFALEHAQHDGLFKMDIPEGWQWIEYKDEVLILYPGTKVVAIDIQWETTGKLSAAAMKTKLQDSNDKMIHEGIEAHNGRFIGLKSTSVDGVYATQLDFVPNSQQPLTASYIAFFNKGKAFSITYSGKDENTLLVLDDMVASFKFK